MIVARHHQQPLKVTLIDSSVACCVSAAEPGACIQTMWEVTEEKNSYKASSMLFRWTGLRRVNRALETMLLTPFTEAMDNWSLGCIAAELAEGSLPLQVQHWFLNVLTISLSEKNVCISNETWHCVCVCG